MDGQETDHGVAGIGAPVGVPNGTCEVHAGLQNARSKGPQADFLRHQAIPIRTSIYVRSGRRGFASLLYKALNITSYKKIQSIHKFI